ncbi:Rrf2 family transcriptional regulator [Campylobacter sp. RM12327]|uniref:RrF2 family transcriptional regulator n=1 Tax=Campylobacter sputorum TaxID=206 RepID=UPI00053BF679|nr:MULTISPECIES: Rrf2 family transcriptional regulator [Campylobacter]ASM39818.1 transcriptional regulator, IscR family [Campylobacter sputorum]MBE7358611.1 Rrf2 family transcriptional regulator [Campylobacter sp. RM11302]MBF6668791.1 Rrf2 family transcriptional regulator [Campylobacter sp. RM12327]MBF6673705.1 Rrf2 family transcriptional regulator [Campylobacter sp. RM13538]MBF6676835.1 Rrf2 family transcriptional regulator [Campylobacter sp. RM12321]
MAVLSTKGIYGLLALFEIMKASEVSPITIKEIAKKTGISKNYFEQILNSLRNAGIISSIKGKNGGYFMAKSPDEISFLDAFSALETNFMISNVYTKNSAIAHFLEDCEAKFKGIFDMQLSKLNDFEDKSKEYLNFII